MTATLHISRRTAPHRPLAGLRTWWNTVQLKHSRRALDAYMERSRLARPITDQNRHAWEAPALEEAFARLAADNPTAVTPADGGRTARETDREQLLLATCDAWFREAHPGPEHRWQPATVTAYQQLMDGVRNCFHPGGDA